MIKPYEHWVLLGIIGAVVVFIVYVWWRSKRNKTLSDLALEKANEAGGPEKQAG
jgi:hypothetical protein